MVYYKYQNVLTAWLVRVLTFLSLIFFKIGIWRVDIPLPLNYGQLWEVLENEGYCN